MLVVSPASLKAEWEEQIAKFSDLPSTIVFGGYPARRAAYRSGTFFTLCNYEQVVADGRHLLDALRPDVVILDEAQRIKNWQTKTANAVKKLRSRYAFVLTGTPLENRIDEIYSIVQFLDPDLLGPLFRFNREFYELDAKGRPSGFRNLEELAGRVSSVMLRRRKEDVENELPGRTTKTFFVPMTETQTSTYEDFELYVKRLARLAERRPLTKEEFDRLQKYLACMRMVCDTPYILGDENRDCPKMEEMERLLPDLLEDPERKIIVFSEWVRMLELVREYAGAAGIDFAWHTGSVPQHRRRAEIRRFREDPDCRLFLSSESGGVGLNLQVADTVVNMDQPWNPGPPGAAHCPRLAQASDPAGRRHQPGERVHHRASHAGAAGGQANAGRRRARPARRPLGDSLADRPGRVHGAAERGARREGGSGGCSRGRCAPARSPPSSGSATTWWSRTVRRCSGSSRARATRRCWWCSRCRPTVSPRRNTASPNPRS